MVWQLHNFLNSLTRLWIGMLSDWAHFTALRFIFVHLQLTNSSYSQVQNTSLR